MNPKLETLLAGVLGVVTQVTCLAVSMSAVKEALQVASLLVGIGVGLLTIRKLLSGK
jgi:hypothetical protein